MVVVADVVVPQVIRQEEQDVWRRGGGPRQSGVQVKRMEYDEQLRHDGVLML
jgi:hypothetical protein